MAKLEKMSIVGAAFGKDSNIGEGVVGTYLDPDGKLRMFKVKGEDHTSTSPRLLTPVDEEKENAIISLANSVCTASRLEQMWQEVFGIGNEKCTPEMKHLGQFIKLINQDVLDEELQTLIEKGITPKECRPKISRIARNWFKDQLEQQQLG